MASQLADYEITSSVLEDGTVPCLRARRPARLGGDSAPVTIWNPGPSGPDTLDGGPVETGTRGGHPWQQPSAVVRGRCGRMGRTTRHLGHRDNTGDRHPRQSTARGGCAGAAAGRRLRCSWRPFVARTRSTPRGHLPPGHCSRRQRPKRWRGIRRRCCHRCRPERRRRARSSLSCQRGPPGGAGWLPASRFYGPSAA